MPNKNMTGTIGAGFMIAICLFEDVSIKKKSLY